MVREPARGEPLAVRAVGDLGLVAEAEERLDAARAHAAAHHVARPRRACRSCASGESGLLREGAVGAAVAAQVGERDEDVARDADDVALAAPLALGRALHERGAHAARRRAARPSRSARRAPSRPVSTRLAHDALGVVACERWRQAHAMPRAFGQAGRTLGCISDSQACVRRCRPSRGAARARVRCRNSPAGSPVAVCSRMARKQARPAPAPSSPRGCARRARGRGASPPASRRPAPRGRSCRSRRSRSRRSAAARSCSGSRSCGSRRRRRRGRPASIASI